MLYFTFFLSLIAFLFQSTIFYLPILSFAPFISIFTLKKSTEKTLLMSCLTGFIMDLFSMDPFGIHALNFTLSSLISSYWKRRFSAENVKQFCLFTAIYSFISTNLLIMLFFIFDRRIQILGKWWLTDWMFLPIFDAMYAFIWFAIPLSLFRMGHKIWTVYWLKKKILSQN